MKGSEPARRPGAFVISLDLELHWGLRDRDPGADTCSERVMGAREAVPRLLDLFSEFGIRATWAVVGLLFAQSREEQTRFSPSVRPTYREPSLFPYDQAVGRSEEDDPLHFGASLVQRIQNTPGQEIATHTFSHYYCGEDGQTSATFRVDLEAAIAIAEERGIRLRSIVFPRNQHEPDYDGILTAAGIRAYRGNPDSPMWRFSSARESASRWKRAGRLIEAYLGSGAHGTTPWSEITRPSGLSDVRASSMLRSYHPSSRWLEGLRLARIRRSMRFAARNGRIFHLWWHPHNFGVHQAENLTFLRRLLEVFADCREQYGMRSFSMADVDAVARGEGMPPDAADAPGSDAVSQHVRTSSPP